MGGFLHFGGGAADEDAFEVFGERQGLVLVLEEDERFAGGGEGEGAGGLGADVRGGSFGIDVRLVEIALDEFHAEHVAHAGVDDFHREAAGSDLAAQRQDEILGRGEVGADVAALAHEHGGGFVRGLRDVVLGVEELDGLAVRDDVAAEAPLLAQAVHQELAAAGNGHAVVVIVGTHHA